MDLTKLSEAQKKLDAHIEKEKGLEGVDLLDKKILALLTELGELANEWRGFKFWRDNQEPNVKVCNRCDENGMLWAVDPNTKALEPLFECDCDNPLLEEYVDCLHFILSIGNDLDAVNKFDVVVMYRANSVLSQFNRTFRCITAFQRKEDFHAWKDILSSFLGLGHRLGFTTDQIEQAYYDKNKINHERQLNGY